MINLEYGEMKAFKDEILAGLKGMARLVTDFGIEPNGPWNVAIRIRFELAGRVYGMECSAEVGYLGKQDYRAHICQLIARRAEKLAFEMVSAMGDPIGFERCRADQMVRLAEAQLGMAIGEIVREQRKVKAVDVRPSEN